MTVKLEHVGLEGVDNFSSSASSASTTSATSLRDRHMSSERARLRERDVRGDGERNKAHHVGARIERDIERFGVERRRF